MSMEETLRALFVKRGADFAIGYQIVAGAVSRALEAVRNHPKFSECEDTCLMYWLEDDDGNELEIDSGRSFCEYCIDQAIESAEKEHPGKQISSAWTYSNCTEADDFETCDICGIHFQSTSLWANGFDQYDESPDEIVRSCEYPSSLYEFEVLFKEGLHCWETAVNDDETGPSDERRWDVDWVIQIWRIANNFCEAFKDGYHIMTPNRSESHLPGQP